MIVGKTQIDYHVANYELEARNELANSIWKVMRGMNRRLILKVFRGSLSQTDER